MGGGEEEAQVNPTQTQHLLVKLLAVFRQAPNGDAREMPPLHAFAHGL